MDRLNKFLTSPRKEGKCVIFVTDRKELTEDEKKCGYFALGNGVPFTTKSDITALAKTKKFMTILYEMLNELTTTTNFVVHNGDILHVVNVEYIFIDGVLVMTNRVSHHQTASIAWPKFPITYWQNVRSYDLWVNSCGQRFKVRKHPLAKSDQSYRDNVAISFVGASDAVYLEYHKDAVETVISEIGHRTTPIKFHTDDGGLHFTYSPWLLDDLEIVDSIFRLHYKTLPAADSKSPQPAPPCSSEGKKCNKDYPNYIPPHVASTLDPKRICDYMLPSLLHVRDKYFKSLFIIISGFFNSGPTAGLVFKYLTVT